VVNGYLCIHGERDVGLLLALKISLLSLVQGSQTFLKLRATSWYRFMRRATSVIHTSEIKILNLSSIMSSLIKIKDIHKCEDTDQVYAIVRTSPRATHVVRAGDLVPAGW